MEASSAPPPMGHNQPTLADSLTIEFSDLMDTIQKLADRANAVKNVIDANGLNSDDDLVPMVEIGREATKLGTSLDRKRKERTEELRDNVKTINGFFDTLQQRADRIKTAFASKIDAYETAKKDRQRREAAERARIAEEEAAAKLKEAEEARHSVMGDVLLNEAAKSEQEAQMAANAAIKAGSGPTRTDAGTVSQSTRFAFDILDSDKIPLEALRPYIKLADFERFVRAYVAANRDKKPLAGVNIFPETKTSFR